MLTLARISPRNIYLNLFGGAHFHWRSLKACNIAKRTCLNYVWTAIFPWSYCSLKLQILRLFRARSSKTVKCRFTLKPQNQPRRCYVRKGVVRHFVKFTEKHLRQSLFLKNETLAQVFSCEFVRTLFYRIPPDDCFLRVRDIIIIFSYSTYYSCKKYNQPLIRKKWNKYFKLRN